MALETEKGTVVEIRVDIDRTLCTYERIDGRKTAVPIREVIDKVNDLFDAGHKITIWTSRNVISRSDQTQFTKKQLASWGVRYHVLDLQKPLFDLFIDDRSVNVHHWMQGLEIPDLGEDI